MGELEDLLKARGVYQNEMRQIGELLAPVLDRLEQLGVEPHMHGAGTVSEPNWWHVHIFEDFTHQHYE
jgi:hypothetical protein